MVTRTRPTKIKTTKILTYVEELLAVDSCLGEENHFLLRIWVSCVTVSDPITKYTQAILRVLNTILNKL